MTAVSCNTGQVTVQARRGQRELIDSLAPEWRELCGRAARDEPFYRPEWVSAYLQAFAPDDRLLLLEARVDGRLAAVMPLVETRSGWHRLWMRKLRGAANIHSCRFDITCEDGPVGEAAVAGIWTALRGIRGWDLIEIPRVPQGGAAEALVTRAARDGYPTGFWQSAASPYTEIDLPEGADPVTLAGHAQFRRDLRRRLRRAMEQYDVRLRRVDEADPEALEAFFELESRGWKGKAGTAIRCSAATRTFYGSVAQAAAQSGYLSLYFLEFDGNPVAGHLGLKYDRRYYLPKVAYDEAYARFSPGQLIMRAIVEDVGREGPAVIDFLGLMSQWKAHWAEETLPHSYCYVFRKGLRGRMLHFGRFIVIGAARSAAHHPSLEPSVQRIQRWLKQRRQSAPQALHLSGTARHTA